MKEKQTQAIARALRTIIKSGSADGDEKMRRKLLSITPVMAAAPDMLEACKAAIRRIEAMSAGTEELGVDPVLKRLKDAVKLAGG